VGTALLVFRLVTRDVRHHLAQAALLVVAIAAAAAALTMGLALNGVTSQQPYAATRAATKSPDVVAYLTSVSQAKKLVDASGVATYSGPYPVASGVIRFNGRIADVFAEGRSTASVAVDQPLPTAGTWVVHRRGHCGHRRAAALSEPLQRDIRRGEPDRFVFLECLSTVVQHPIPLAPRTPGTQ
jgi:hypothetical protein